MKSRLGFAIVLSLIFHAGHAAYADPYKLQYGGRLTQNNGQPVAGTVSIVASFYGSGTGGSSLASQTFSSIPLQDGIFNLTIELTPAEFNHVFSASEVWIEISDTISGKIYPRQRFTAVPFAFKVPTDGSTLGFDSNGRMRVQGLAGQSLPSTSPADGQILKWRSSSGWEWGSDEVGTASAVIDSTAIQDGSISNVDIASGAAIAGSKIVPNFGAQNITTTGLISGNGSGLTNLPTGPLGTSIDSSEIVDGTVVDADIAAGAAIAQSKINGLSASLAAKEGVITPGTSSQYLRGDKSWSTLDTSAIPENTNLYFTNARARGAISVSAPLVYDDSAGLVSLPAATSVAAGYLSSADWLSFSGKQAAITAASTVNTGTLTSALQNGLQLKPFGASAGEAGELRFTEVTGAGSNHIGFKAPDSIVADKVWTLPPADGTNGQFLSTNGSGVLSWASDNTGTVTSITAGTGLSGGTISGSGTINLANTAVSAGSYIRANITVDSQGRLTAAADGSSVNLTSEVTGTLPVGNGGTGLSSGTSGGISYFSDPSTIASSATLSSNGVVLGGGAGSAPTSTAAGTANQVFRVPSGSGAPAFGAIDVSQSAAVTGVLPIANGGTGSSTSLNNSRIMVSSSGQIREASALSNGQLLIGSTGAAPVAASIAQGSNAGVTISAGAGSLTLDTAQDIRTSASPAFAGLSLSGSFAAATHVAGSSDNTTSPLGGSLRAANGSGSNITGSNLSIAAGNGTGTGGSGSISFQTAPSESVGSTANTLATRMTIDKNGNVGIGTTVSPAKLYVQSGQVAANANYTASGATIDFNTGNIQVLGAATGSTITLNNMVDGGSYTLIIQDMTSRTYTFPNCTNYKYFPANTPTTAGTHSIYNILKLTISAQTWCYIFWMSES